MVWILAFLVPLVAGVVHARRSRRALGDFGRSCEIVLRYLCGGLFGVWMITTGLFHVFAADSVARYIGWPAGSPFQLELGFASVGLGLVALRLALLPKTDLLAAWLGGSVFYLGAAAVHASDMLAHDNFNPGNAGPVFYVDILAPVVALGLWLASRRPREPAVDRYKA